MNNIRNHTYELEDKLKTQWGEFLMNITNCITNVAPALMKAETTVQIKNLYLPVSFSFWNNSLTGNKESVFGDLVHILPLTS